MIVVLVIDGDGVSVQRLFRSEEKANKYRDKIEKELCELNEVEVADHFSVEVHLVPRHSNITHG